MSLELLSNEYITYVRGRMQDAKDTGRPLVFRRTNSDKPYQFAIPPRPRYSPKMISPDFVIFDKFANKGENPIRNIKYTQGTQQVQNGLTIAHLPKPVRPEFDEAGFIRPDEDDVLLIACLLLDSRNETFRWRSKSVQPEWYEVKEKVKAKGSTEVLRLRTEAAISQLVLGMKFTELQEYAVEMKNGGANISINGQEYNDLVQQVMLAVKKDPLLFGQSIPSEESRLRVLIMQAVNMDVIAADKEAKEWKFLSGRKDAFCQFPLNGSPENELVKFLKTSAGKEVRSRISKTLFPSDDEGWEFLEEKQELEIL